MSHKQIIGCDEMRERGIVVFYEIEEPSGYSCTGSCRLVRPKEAPLPNGPLSLVVRGSGRSFEIVPTVTGYLSPVFFSLSEGGASFSQNAVFLAPLVSTRVICTTDAEMTEEEFVRRLRVQTIPAVPIDFVKKD